jgi:cyclic-di-GMP phosphodiesterase TipF (flagellum assembly factor)
MIRISTIFIALCMVLVSASAGVVLYSVTGLPTSQSAVVALAALIILILYNAVSMRMRGRNNAEGQIADLSQGVANLARQVSDFGRRLAAAESKLAATESKIVLANSAGSDRVQSELQSALGEINELGGLVKQLAATVAAHDDMLTAVPSAVSAPAVEPAQLAGAVDRVPLARTTTPAMTRAATNSAQPHKDAQVLATIQNAIETGGIDIFLQPIVTLPQRKIRYYEAMTRLRNARGAYLAAGDFIPAAESVGLMGQLDNTVLLRCMQVLQRLHSRNKDAGLFCNLALATLGNPETFAQCLDLLAANRALAPSLILEFKHEALRRLDIAESKRLTALTQLGYGLSVDHVTNLRIEPRELADRGVRFIKVPASLLLDHKQTSTSDIHPADMSDLLGRFGIDLIAERIEDEVAVVDLLDYNVRFGQGFLFAAPRPLRQDAADKAKSRANSAAGPPEAGTVKTDAIKPERSPRMTGNAALARRAGGAA